MIQFNINSLIRNAHTVIIYQQKEWHIMAEDNIQFLKQFIGSSWANSEFKKINEKSPLGETGSSFVSYHPWVHYMYEIQYSLRRAKIEKQDDIVLGPYHYILDNAGMLLKHNLELIINKNDARKRLRNAQQFYDFIWELETRTMLSLCGARAEFIDPTSGNTFDGSVTPIDRTIPFECKNKIVDNDQFRTNSIFAHLLTQKLGDVESVQGKIVLVEFTSARLEDIKPLVSDIRENLDIFDYRSILGRYRIRVLRKVPFNTPGDILLGIEGVNQVFCITDCKKSELYLERAPSSVARAKILFRMPDQVREVSNLNSVLKKAHSQLALGGILFLQVPYSAYENAKIHIKKEIAQGFPNIYAVKIVALDVSPFRGEGVKISREEDFIISSKGKAKLTNEESAFFSQPMIFMKFAKKPYYEK